MIQHTFGIPIWENDFDTEEIKLENELQRRWESETLTSYGLKNDLTKSSIDYILQQLVELFYYDCLATLMLLTHSYALLLKIQLHRCCSRLVDCFLYECS